MTDNTAKTLVQKLALASALVGGKLKADKKNMQDNYEYVSANKILSECGQALADNGISIIPSIKARDVQVFDRGNGKYRYDATVDMAFKITDGVTSFEETWFGMGSDYTVPDKAMYKAITSGHKYFISKLFCIGEGNEDSEHDTPEDVKPAPKPAQAQRPAQPPAQHAPIAPIPSAPVVRETAGPDIGDGDNMPFQGPITQSHTGEDYAEMSVKDLAGRHAHYSKLSRDASQPADVMEQAKKTADYIAKLITEKRNTK
jgi:hypothetical protein